MDEPKSTQRLSREMMKRIRNDAMRPSEARDSAFLRAVLSIPKGKVATYGAAAAGYPLYHRAVARLLRTEPANRFV